MTSADADRVVLEVLAEMDRAIDAWLEGQMTPQQVMVRCKYLSGRARGARLMVVENATN